MSATNQANQPRWANAAPIPAAADVLASGANDAVRSLHDAHDAAHDPRKPVDRDATPVDLVNTKAATLAGREQTAAVEMARIFALACTEHPRGQAGVADAIGRTKQYVGDCADADTMTSLGLRYLPMLPRSVLKVLLARVDERYLRESAAAGAAKPVDASRLVIEVGALSGEIQREFLAAEDPSSPMGPEISPSEGELILGRIDNETHLLGRLREIVVERIRLARELR